MLIAHQQMFKQISSLIFWQDPAWLGYLYLASSLNLQTVPSLSLKFLILNSTQISVACQSEILISKGPTDLLALILPHKHNLLHSHLLFKKDS